MKFLPFIVLFSLFTMKSYSQKVYSVDYENQADVKVYVVQYENQTYLKDTKWNMKIRLELIIGTGFYELS